LRQRGDNALSHLDLSAKTSHTAILTDTEIGIKIIRVVTSGALCFQVPEGIAYEKGDYDTPTQQLEEFTTIQCT
jgi:hypothetical protein